MFTVDYNYFVDHSFFSDYSISYMPGLKVKDMNSAKVVVNVDTKTAYVYWGIINYEFND